VSFSDFDVTRHTRKGNFLNQIDQLINWNPIEQAITQHYVAKTGATGHPAYPRLLLFKILRYM
jgi:IS5 family transposase